jgi:hypothetical protein
LNVTNAKIYKCFGCAPKHCMYLSAPLCNMVYTGKSKAQKLFMWSRERKSPCTMPPLRVKRLCFSQAKTAFLMQQQQHTTTTQLVGRGSAKIVIPKIKQMTERGKEHKEAYVLVGEEEFLFSQSCRQNYFHSTCTMRESISSTDKCDSLYRFIH